MNDALQIPVQVNPLMDHLRNEGERRRQELTTAADAEVAAILADTEAEKKALRQTAEAERESLENDLINAELKQARLANDARIKQALGQEVDALIDVAGRTLDDYVQSEAFVPVMAELIRETLEAVAGFNSEKDVSLGCLHVPPRFEAAAKDIIAKSGFAVDINLDDSIADGVFLKSGSSNQTFTNTLSARLARRNNAVRMAVAGLLNNALNSSAEK